MRYAEIARDYPIRTDKPFVLALQGQRFAKRPPERNDQGDRKYRKPDQKINDLINRPKMKNRKRNGSGERYENRPVHSPDKTGLNVADAGVIHGMGGQGDGEQHAVSVFGLRLVGRDDGGKVDYCRNR
ncbi:hypothetical protein [Paenibacillus cisolokensis]|uniref:hypothetical protein n=1 Tax=Paenibacillus cisolokensis TaxID=1658519 RepID=UPI001FD5DCEA|nr:hypothetical protein [Paenibacillus cisolokensis]